MDTAELYHKIGKNLKETFKDRPLEEEDRFVSQEAINEFARQCVGMKDLPHFVFMKAPEVTIDSVVQELSDKLRGKVFAHGATT